MIYGELGRYPLEINIKSRIISFWAKLLSGKELTGQDYNGLEGSFNLCQHFKTIYIKR
jgi:hypothetical protein